MAWTTNEEPDRALVMYRVGSLPISGCYTYARMTDPEIDGADRLERKLRRRWVFLQLVGAVFFSVAGISMLAAGAWSLSLGGPIRPAFAWCGFGMVALVLAANYVARSRRPR